MCRSMVDIQSVAAEIRRGKKKKKKKELECGPMPNVMVALPNIGGALCSTPQFGSRPLLKCRAVTLPKYESARLGGCKVNFAPGKIP